MNLKFNDTLDDLRNKPKAWLITGVAGFIGSNILEFLLINNQKVVGLDNFSTGHKNNLERVKNITQEKWKNFSFREGSICDLKTCKEVSQNIDYILHQGALGSVPRSIEDPISSNNSNISGFLNMLVAAKDNDVKKFVYAASSSTYGDHKDLPKVEHIIGNPLSPYAVTKFANELYGQVFASSYNFNSVGLRYFNVLGKRQDPNGAYAAVIPRWIDAMINKKDIEIFGDGETTRDFCYIDNVVEANILAALSDLRSHEVFNIAIGEQTSLNELLNQIAKALSQKG